MSASNSASWGSSYRLVAAEKWKAKSAIEKYRVADEIRFGVYPIFVSGKA